MINASIITIGDELLIGQVIDTNSAFIAQQMNKAGFAVIRRLAVGDDYDAIWTALDEEKKHADIILITGGLGPTADDITKPLLCEYFGGKMIVDEPSLANVKHLFENIFKRPFTERNQKQAEVPDVCTVIQNKKGTAPGMLFSQKLSEREKIFVSMPGVPFEMMAMMTDDVIPYLKQKFTSTHIVHRTLLTSGIGESMLADMIIDFENDLPKNIKLAYLPSYGMVRLRLTATGENTTEVDESIEQQFSELKILAAEFLVTDVDETMEKTVGKLLLKNGKTMSTAESCTGGYIAHLITAIAGSSAFYNGSVVSYSNEVKENLLQVKKQTLDAVGAVSEEVVKEMAAGALKNIGTDYTIAVSGIMGPDGGVPDKPVGTVWVCVGSIEKLVTHKFTFRFDRERNIRLTALNALNMLRKFILENN
ncbi:MAG: competence/damage-inducible protein A [Ferruginibacter sp.]|nr:competence/damage-inducible protein A [Ferruginibacter sp.]